MRVESRFSFQYSAGPMWLPRIDVPIAALLGFLCVLTVWRALGLSPETIFAPVVYAGDGLQYSYIISSFGSEGGLDHIANAGAPFTTQNVDFPNGDVLNYALASILGSKSQPGLHYNLFILLSALLVSITSWSVLRSFRVNRALAFVGTLAFSLLPYVFYRYVHLTYANYASAPLAFWLAANLHDPIWLSNDGDRRIRIGGKSIKVALAALFCGTTGVYFGFFTCLVLMSACLAAAAEQRSARPILRAAVIIGIICAALFVQLIPTLVLRAQDGLNFSVAVRSFEEAELYGLKLTELLLPMPDHPIRALADFARIYNERAPLPSANLTNSIGAVGSIGLLMTILALVATPGTDQVPWFMRVAPRIVLALLMFATIAGFSSFFAMLISPNFRGLYRIAPFVSFPSILFLLGIAQMAGVGRVRLALPIALIFTGIVSALVVLDQVPGILSPPRAAREATLAQLQVDQHFVREVESAVGAEGSLILQLPYMEYPESGHALGDYTQFRNNINAPNLHWSYGAMKGRPEGRWLQLLAMSAPAMFSDAVRNAGFAAVVVDKRAETPQITAQVEALGWSPKVISQDGTQVAFVAPAVVKAGRAAAPAFGFAQFEATSDQAGTFWAGDAASLRIALGSEKPCRLDLAFRSALPTQLALSINGQVIKNLDSDGVTPASVSVTIPPNEVSLDIASSIRSSPAAGEQVSPRVFGLDLLAAPVCLY